MGIRPGTNTDTVVKLRDSAAKLARYTREEARHTGPLYKGSCGPQSCLFGIEEVACMPFNNTDYYCLCTSNGLPPTRDYKCPRSTVPVTPMPIHNIIPPTTSNTSAESRAPSDEVIRNENAFSGILNYWLECTNAKDYYECKLPAPQPQSIEFYAGPSLDNSFSLSCLVRNEKDRLMSCFKIASTNIQVKSQH
ncbi:hypothetical protein evm_014486 [Chilo suppressalis]|nr:hypothetical protein evm_014486 [Chilo suppressalis]